MQHCCSTLEQRLAEELEDSELIQEIVTCRYRNDPMMISEVYFTP